MCVTKCLIKKRSNRIKQRWQFQIKGKIARKFQNRKQYQIWKHPLKSWYLILAVEFNSCEPVV